VSYILDALKKLEKERKRGSIPGLNEQDFIVYHSQKKSAWPYMLISVVFLVAGVLIAWYFLTPSNNSGVANTSTTAVKTINQDSIENTKPPFAIQPLLQPPVALPAPAVKSDDTKPGVKNDKALKGSVKGKDSLDSVSAVPAETRQKEGQHTGKEIEPVQIEPVQTIATQTKPIKETSYEPPIRQKLYKFSELPPSVRDSLKKFFTITAYMYSHTPSERKVRINDKMMQEGQELEPGIRIEEIVPDGVILSYKKFRFFVSLK
jgi:general secretion pathway protein B